MNEGYQTAVGYRSYHLIHTSPSYDDDAALGVQELRKKLAVQMKDQAFNRHNLISVINFLTKFKRAWDPLRINEIASVWLYREFMIGPALASNKVRLALLSNMASRYEGPITSHARV